MSHDREARPAARSTRGKAWPLTAAVAVGLLAGLGGFTFVYGDGAAYLSNDPAACANCHVMQDHFDSWQKSGHRHVAVCNDCHLPPSFADKWLTKLDNGMMHSLVFTTGGFPNPIRIKPRNRRRTQAACLHCHGALVEALAPVEPGGDTLTCADCHRDVGHALR